MSAIAPLPSVQVQVGVPIASDGSRVTVTTSASLASPSPETAIVTADEVGWVLSIVMADPEDRLVIADAIAFPARSEYVHEKPTVPSWSLL